MPDSYDGIIIGGGINGLIAAAYLAKSGLKIGVFERMGEAGGGMRTEEATLPGFYHNLHGIHCKFHDTPMYYDLELEKFGAGLIYPEVKVSIPFSDGKSLICHTDLKKTCESLSKFSQKDGKKFEKIAEQWNNWYNQIITPEIFNPPLSQLERKDAIRKTESGEDYLEAESMSVSQYANELFEDDRNKGLFIWAALATSYTTRIQGISPIVFFTFITWLTRKLCLVRGGTQQYARALVQSIASNQGVVNSASHVNKIIVNDGAATGIQIQGGRKITANKFVVSAVDPVQTLLKLVGEERVGQDIAKKISKYKWEDWAIFGGHLALNEPPKHKAAKHDPRVNKALKYVIGNESSEGLARHAAELAGGKLSRDPGFGGGCLTLFDPSQAPPGKHTAYFWAASPYELKNGGAERWDEVKLEYLDRCLEKWREYAPNLNSKNILAKAAYTPYDISRKVISMVRGGFNLGRISPDQNGALRPIDGMGNYRTPIKGLYLTGAGTHPGGTMIGAAGYNAASVIVENLGIAKWWSNPHHKLV
ncbi:MAG: phytoene desaturase family protein [Nitrososphaerales archaeon]